MFIDENTPIFPGDQKPEIRQVATIKENGWNEKRISFNSHFSTHMDAPFHMLEEGKKLDEFPIETFIGEAIVLELNKPKLDSIEPEDIVFFYTGHMNKAGSKEFFENNPVLSQETAKALVDKKVKIVGINSLSPDNSPFKLHKIFFKSNILIVENLVNLDKLINKRFRCYILPLKIKNADGAPCRVIGILD